MLKIIPTAPSFIPSKTNIEKVIAFLNSYYTGKQIEYNQFDSIEFIDQGENFGSVNCNKCNKLIEIDTWQEVMDEAHKTNFENLSFLTPCCNKNTSLNDLDYHSPAGFSKFTITINDAEKDIEKNSLQELETLLDTKLKLIWVHY